MVLNSHHHYHTTINKQQNLRIIDTVNRLWWQCVTRKPAWACTALCSQPGQTEQKEEDGNWLTSAFLSHSSAGTMQTNVFDSIWKFLSNFCITFLIVRELESIISWIYTIPYDLLLCVLSAFTPRDTFLGAWRGREYFHWIHQS